MSFSENIKKELSEIGTELCCKKAECFGLLLFGRAFSLSEISILTQSSSVAYRYHGLVKALFDIDADISRSRAGKYTVSITNRKDTARILSEFGYTGKEVALRINHANLENDCCMYSFLRGVFLSCGSVTNPEKDYHLEFLTPKQKLSLDLKRIIEDFSVTPKQIRRKSGYALYVKDGESVEDILGFMGAANSFLHMMNVRASKDMRNKINRQMNFESANLNRTIEANMAQIDNIYTITRLSSLKNIDDDLALLANLRLDNREATLAELGEMMTPQLSRCAVGRRFKKIEAIANELKKAEKKYESIHNQ